MLNRISGLSPMTVIVAGLILGGCQTTPLDRALTAADEGSFVFRGIDNYWRGNTSNLSGILDFPSSAKSGQVPLVVLLHGSAGPGYRSRSWGEYFRDNGFATFRLDYYTQRGLTRGGRGGPASAADVYSTLKFLKSHPRIDTTKIAVMGFSRGGSITFLSIDYDEEDTGGIRPAAFIALYGGCERFVPDQGTPNVPILILVGEHDTLTSVEGCRIKMEMGKDYGKDIKTVVYPNAYHGFDDDRTRTVQFGGQSVKMVADSAVTAKARAEVLQTLRRAFGQGV